jgi:hypothetical protein
MKQITEAFLAKADRSIAAANTLLPTSNLKPLTSHPPNVTIGQERLGEVNSL